MNKICTTIEQSKKLAEILPLESADMWYEDVGLIIPRLGHMPKEHTDTEVPCWSLGALISLLPKRYCLEKLDDGTYACYNFLSQYEKFGKTQIEAVYSMIVFLKEEKII